MTEHQAFTFVSRDGEGVAARRHQNPDGTLGGWVAVTATVPKNAHVAPGAIVGPGEIVPEGASVKARTPMRGTSLLRDKA